MGGSIYDCAFKGCEESVVPPRMVCEEHGGPKYAAERAAAKRWADNWWRDLCNTPSKV